MSFRTVLASCLLLAACSTETTPIPPMNDDAGTMRDSGTDSGVEPQCDNAMKDGDESGIDCGGSCPPCANGENCLSAEDCESSVCERGRCLVPNCTDGVRNGDETGTDCGGDCALCGGGQPCTSNDECLSGRCRGGECTMSNCEDMRQNGTETDIDCGGDTCPRCAGGLSCLDRDDCSSMICAAGTCTDAACNDRVQNQDETSVDCGGAICPACRDGLACMVDSDCMGMRCFDGGCVSCTDLILNAEETDVDCGGPLCEACDDGEACLVDSDCAGGACEAGLCVSCMDGVLNQDETDIDCGGTLCGGCRDGAACLVDGDCSALGATCDSGSCVSCADRVRNRDETDLDCGGATCPACAPGLMCSVDADCASNICDGPTMRCNAPGCGDGVLNGAETDLDCGGGSCLGCDTGEMCLAGRDCLSGVCTAGTCEAPTCMDGVRNGGETDVDCGGSTACPRCADRQLCSSDTDCTAGVCTTPPGRCGTFTGCFWGLIGQESQFTDPTIQGLFTANGHTFDVLDMNGTTGVHSSDPAVLSRYTHIILHEHDRILSSAELTALTNWINAGGRLIVTGYDSLGSPTDSVLGGLVRCASPGDGPFSGALSVVNALHPIALGPAQTFTMGQSLTSGSTDHDQCTPTGGAVRIVAVSGSSKLQITEGIGGTGGMVVYWNGNGSGSGPLVDWVGTSGTQPALQNLFVNTLNHLCVAP